MKFTNKYIYGLVIAVMFLFITGCISTTKALETTKNFQKSKKQLFLSNKKQTTILFKQNKKGESWFELTSPFISGAAIRGEIKSDGSSDYTLYIEAFHFLVNWPNGWTEGEYEASGQINLILDRSDDLWHANIVDKFEIWDIKKGAIRYFDDYYQDQKGMDKVKNRMVRIQAVVSFLKQQKAFPKLFGHLWKKSSYGKSLKKIVGKFIRNKSTVYPEELIPLKESGTLTRDFEEAAGLFLIDYNMEYYLNEILNGATFKIKKIII